MPVIKKSDVVQSNTLLSLQDICKLNVLFNLELFPDHVLSKLPIHIRIRMFKTLPIFDRLHFAKAEFCKDLDICPPLQQDETVSYNINGRVLYGNNEQMKEKLLKCLFLSKYDAMQSLLEGCGLNLKEASYFVDFLSTAVECEVLAQSHFSYIERFLPCKVFSSPFARKRCNVYQSYLIIPVRFVEFLNTDIDAELQGFPSNINVTITDPHKFISYCNLHTVAPSTLSIDTIQLVCGSAIWREYDTILTSAIERHLSSSSTGVPIVNPISPLLQNILASVEHLSIGTINPLYSEPSDSDYEYYDNVTTDAPNFILTNIISQEKPRLKSIRIHGETRTDIDFVETVAVYLCGVRNLHPITGVDDYCYTAEGVEYSLLPPSKWCTIEELVITAEVGFRDWVCVFNCAIVSRAVKKIIDHQRATLKHLSLIGIGFIYEDYSEYNDPLTYLDVEIVNCDEYRSLLNTTLVDFVQLPQFESLELGDSPDTECYPLILAFMTTPTSHEQKLVISLRPDSKQTISDWCEQYPIPKALPSSNIQFKSLVLKGKHSPLINQLFSFPDLSLKFFHISTVQLMCKLPGRVSIDAVSLLVDSEQIDTATLDVFISQNPSLLTLNLQFFLAKQFPFFGTVNKCLVGILQKKGTLDSVVLKHLNLADCVMLPKQSLSFAGSDEEGYDFTKWMPSQEKKEEMDLATWFTSFPHQSVDISVEAAKNEFLLFLCLLQKLNSTLTISSSDEYDMHSLPEPDLEYLISTLEHVFERSRVKMRKITLIGELKKYEESFKRIASSVICK